VKWRAISEHTIESDAGYRVLECTANGVPTGRYLAFIGATTARRIAQVFDAADSGEEARQLCEAHKAQKEVTG
jgi:S-ribosylhomocysteine lyase LuxS involved in autoinducer biosynthesis